MLRLSYLNLFSPWPPCCRKTHADKQIMHLVCLFSPVSQEKGIFSCYPSGCDQWCWINPEMLSQLIWGKQAHNTMCTCMPLNEVFQRNRHLLLHGAGVVNMARDVEELCPRVSLSAKAHKPRASTATDGGCHGYRLHVGNSCRATKHTCKKQGKVK